MKTGLRIIASPLCVVAGVLLLWLPPQVAALSGYAPLSQRAESVVDEVTAQNLAAFAGVSAIKTGLAIIEDSSVGVGFQLQVGDAVQAVYDYVNFVWDSLLYSLLVLSGYKMLLETQLLHLGLQMLGLGLLAASLAFAWPRAPRSLHLGAARAIFAGLLFAYVVPVSLLTMHFATVHYTGPLKVKQAARIEELRLEVDRLSGKFGTLKSSIDVLHPLDTASVVRQQISEIAASISDTVSRGTQAMLYYVVIVLFELLVFPVLSAYLLMKLLGLFFGRLLGGPQPVRMALPLRA